MARIETADNRLPICDGREWFSDNPDTPILEDFEMAELRKAACLACRRAYNEGRKRAAEDTRLDVLHEVWAELHHRKSTETAESVVNKMIDACPVPFGDCEKEDEE